VVEGLPSMQQGYGMDPQHYKKYVKRGSLKVLERYSLTFTFFIAFLLKSLLK
jgi:hypothetical protein